MNETHALLILNAVSGIGNTTLRKLLNVFGKASDVLKAGPDSLARCSFLNKAAAAELSKFKRDEFLKNELRLMAEEGVDMFTQEDVGYPYLLAQIPDAPLIMYRKGSFPDPANPFLAIVGSRHASTYGRLTAEQFACRLAGHGVVVVSGLARGIDIAAHLGCLKAFGQTVAVLGSGFCHIYPKEHQKWVKDIERSGCLLSEFPMQTTPAPYNFPRRNRIVSGLSLGVVVIEAAKKSGALITADFALEQGRDVFAVPGSIDNPYSQGPHALIKEGAKLVHSVEDILEELPVHRACGQANLEVEKQSPGISIEDLSQQESSIFSILTDQPLHLDDIVSQSSCETKKTQAALLNLELRQLIKQWPGKHFSRAQS